MAKIKQKDEEIELDPADAEQVAFFPEAGRGKTLLHIVNLAKFNPGMIILMGDEGSGRSLLLQKLALRVNQKPGLLAIINRVVKTKPDLYRAIAESFSLDVIENESIDALEERVLEFLQGSFVTHRPVILAVDDIQQFSLSMLEELIKLLRRFKKISLLLIGDKNLSAMLKHLDTEKAVRHEITLLPPNRGEMRQYINWRLPFSIDDHEFEDIVNTTKGNFALLEREAQKKEMAHQSKQSAGDNLFRRKLHFDKQLGLILLVFVVIAGVVTYYFVGMGEKPSYAVQSQPTPSSVTTAPSDDSAITKPVVEPSADDASKNVIVDRQFELLTATPEVTKPEIKTSVVDIVQKPIAVEIKVPEEQKVVEKPKPAIEPKRVVAVKPVVTPVVPEVPVAVVMSKPPAVKAKISVHTDEDDSAVLLSMDPHHFSIQVLGAQSKKTMDIFVATHQDIGKLYAFRSEKDGKDWYIVMCNEYENRQAAIQATATLPDDLKKTSPWARRLSEIHALINARPAR